jgi:hypothetical protein
MVVSILSRQRLPLVGKADPEAADVGADERPLFGPEDEDRIADAAALFTAALENVEGMINTLNESLGELDRFFEHFTKEDKKRFRMLIYHAERAEKRQTSAEQLEQVGWTAGSHGGHDRAAAILGRKWAGDFAASAELQREFGDVETYIAFRRASFAGQVRIVGAHAAGSPAPRRPSGAGGSPGKLTVTQLTRLYEATPRLQEEFGGDLEAFLAFKKHEQAGHVQILRRK